jgi:uncharacterized protein (TIGR03067 family)
MNSPAPALEGTWQMIRAELKGELAPALVTSQTVLELKAGTYTVRYAGQVMDTGTYELGAEPGRMVLHGTSGPNAGRTIPSLYQLAGNRLRVWYGLDAQQPHDFQLHQSKLRYSVAYKRHINERPYLIHIA